MINVSLPTNQGELLNVQKKLKKENQLSFEGRRTDHNLVKELVTDNGTLNKPKERQIETAIRNLGEDSSSYNVRFLLNVAKNLKYGVRKGSALDRFLSQDSSISDKDQKQLVDWESLLKSSLEKALSNNKTPEKQSLMIEFKNIFADKQVEKSHGPTVSWLSVSTNFKVHKELIKLRNSILESSEFVNGKDEKQKAQAKKHLDYFIASSEVAFTEKVECLKLLDHLMSDKYEINPQLKDYKVQIFAEMINDLVIKTPEEEKLTAKKMLQKHGTCAAISTSRKALAHEHKLMYTANLVAEFDAKPTMEIFDVTDPKNEAKITVEKANIDYRTAIEDEDYRIVDAAVTNWMHIADQMGNGLTKAGQFIPFDAKNYDMFRDSHLTLNMDPEVQPMFDVLRATMKTKSVIKGLQADLAGRAHAKIELNKSELENNTLVSININQVKNILSSVVEKSGAKAGEIDLKALANTLMKPKSYQKKNIELLDAARKETNSALKAKLEAESKDLEEKFIIVAAEGNERKKAKLTNIINDAIPNVSQEALKEAMEEIYKHYTFITDLTSHDEGLNNKFSMKGQIPLFKKLFTLAAYNRVRKEFEVEVPEMREDLAKELGVVDTKEAVLKKLEDTGVILPRKVLDEIYNEFKAIGRYNDKMLERHEEGWVSPMKLYENIMNFKPVFTEIRKSLTSIRREVIRDDKMLNELLEPYLNEVYDQKGKGLGINWVGPEGSSGLQTSQYSRLMKQMSGKDHFVSADPKEVLDHVQAGKGGSVTGTMVSHTEYSGHAQYVRDITEEQVLNKETGKTEKQRVLWHDNTWGKAENKGQFKDDSGQLRTNYGSGRGGPNGYMLSPEMTQGTTESELLSGTGIHKPSQIDKEWAKKFDSAIGNEYPLFMDTVLRGPELAADSKAKDIVSKLLQVVTKQSEQKTQAFVQRLMMGNLPVIDKLKNDLTLSVYNLVYEVIDEGNLDALNANLEKLVQSHIKGMDNNIFKTVGKKTEEGVVPVGGKDMLVQLVSNNLPLYIDQVMSSDQPEAYKKVSIAKVVEDFVKQAVYTVTKPGQSIPIQKDDNVSKNANKLEESLMNIIKGKKTGIATDKSVLANGISSKEIYDAIPEDNLLKILLAKMVMIDKVQDNVAYIAVDKAKTPEELEKAHKLIVEKHKDQFRAFFNKTNDSSDMLKMGFENTAMAVISEFGKEAGINVDPLLAQIKPLVENIVKQSNGSTSILRKKVRSVQKALVAQFSELTKGQKPELEAKLSVKLDAVINETFDKMLNINSVKELEANYLGQAVITWIDSKFDPKNDQEFLVVVRKLQDMTRENFDKLLEKSTPEELAFKYKDKYEIVQKIRGLNENATKNFKNAVVSHVYNQQLAQKTEADIKAIIESHKEWLKTEEASVMNPEDRRAKLNKQIQEYYETKADLSSVYRNMKMELSTVGLESFLKTQKAQAQKLGIHQSFPIINTYSDEQISEVVSKNLDQLQAMLMQTNSLRGALEQYKDQPEAVKQVKQQIQSATNSIKMQAVTLVKGLMRPRHQNDVMQMLNAWLKEASRNPDSDLSKEMRKELEAQMLENYITKFPAELLEIAVRSIPEMLYNRDQMNISDNNVIKLWSQSLADSLTAAKRAQVDFKIKELIQKGKMPQVAKMLRNPENPLLVNTKTQDIIPLESDKGIELVLGALNDPTNKNSTLKYFVQQSGMTESFVNYFVKGGKPEKTVELIQVYTDQLNQIKDDKEIILSIYDVFTKSLTEKIDKDQIGPINLDGLEAIINEYSKVLIENFETAGKANSKTLHSYIHQLQENIAVAKMMKIEPPKGDAMNLFVGWQENIMNGYEANTEEVIEKIILHTNRLQAKLNGLNMFNDLVPDYSPLKTKMNEQKIAIQRAVEKLAKIQDELQAPILEKVIAQNKEKQAEQAKQVEKMQKMTQEELMLMMQKESQAVIEALLKAINAQDQVKIQYLSQQIVQAQNPLMDQLLVKYLLNEENDNPIFKTFCAGLLGQKGQIQPLAGYIAQSLDENGNLVKGLDLQKNQALILAADGLVEGLAKFDNPAPVQQLLGLLASLFVSSCDDSEQSQLKDQLLNLFINKLVDKGPVIDEMLMSIINHKPAHINGRCVAINILSRNDSMSFLPLFNEILFNTKDFADSVGDQLMMKDVSLMGVYNVAKKVPGINYSNTLKELKALDIDQLVKDAKAEGKLDSELIDKLAKNLLERTALLEQLLAEYKEQISEKAA